MTEREVEAAPLAPGVLAALPMYDLPELQACNDALWSALRQGLQRRGVDTAPASLTRTEDLNAVWRDPRLLVAQTCGYPLATRLRPYVRIVLTPRYRARGCDGPFHRAAILVREGSHAQALGDLRGARLALNARDSNTGMNLLRAELAPIVRGGRMFAEVITTGSHAESAAAVAQGRADLASLDCVTWALLQRLRPRLTANLRVLAWTPRAPGLPLVTSRMTDRATFTALQAALIELAHDPALACVRRDLLLEDFHPLSEAYYSGVLHFERFATGLGYPELV